MEMRETKPKPLGVDAKTDPSLLYLGRYGTDDTIKIWGSEQTFQSSLDTQAAASKTLSELYSDIVPPEHAEEIIKAASLNVIDPQRIREIEEKTGHDVIAINKSLQEKLSPDAATHVNKCRTSADTTETAKALQMKRSIEVISNSLENLRDITIEKAMKWIDIPHMDTTHWLDALPTVAGRPFAFYAEMLQSDLDFLSYVYAKSIKGKWADATGNHHSATTLGIDGMKLQEMYCKNLKIGNMLANAQIPGREFLTDVIYTMARTAQTMANLAFYMAWGKGSDVNIFFDANPKKRKGSSAMPHKDMVGGNPTTEEQTESFAHTMAGNLTTSLVSCKFRYGRDLSGSASDRDIFPATFKMGDHVTRRMASAVYHLGLNEKRSRERVERTYGVTTSEQVMTCLTDKRIAKYPMPRDEAHDLMGELATKAYREGRPFIDVLLENDKVRDCLSETTLREMTDPFRYIGQSREIIKAVAESCYKRRTLP